MVNASPLLVAAFVSLAFAVAFAFLIAVYRAAVATVHPDPRGLTARVAAGTAVWIALTGALAAAGMLSFSSRPPTMLVLLPAIFAIAIWLGTSRLGGRLAAGLPLAALVGAQSFRLPLELTMHRAYTEGLMPVQMSYSGRNLDIVTGVTAIVVAAILVWRPVSLWLVRVWNVVGLALLANILTVAVLSAPTPLRRFHNEPANVWIEHAPWVWLPAVFVLAAIAGHILVYRRLRYEARQTDPVGRAAPGSGRAVTL